MSDIKIEIQFTEVAPCIYEGFRIPTTNSGLYPDTFREEGCTAKVVDFNRLIVTTPYGYAKEFVVSFEMTGIDHHKMWLRDTDANIRFWKAVERVVIAKLTNTVRYINRAHW